MANRVTTAVVLLSLLPGAAGRSQLPSIRSQPVGVSSSLRFALPNLVRSSQRTRMRDDLSLRCRRESRNTVQDVVAVMSLEVLLQSTDPTIEIHGQKLFEVLKREAEELADSPVIGAWVREAILDAADLPDAMARIISGHFRSSPALFDQDAATQVMKDICASNVAVRRGVILDLVKALEADFAVESVIQPFLNFKGLHAISLARITRALWLRGTSIARNVALALQSHGSMVYGIDIHPSAKLGNGIFVDHATGLVIGGTAIVGDNVLVLHGVTLGATGKMELGKRHPTVGDNVNLGALSTILGDVTIGSDAVVGAQAVVTKGVAQGETVVGINKVGCVGA
eukprot:1327189-Amorphochlora_amoeboformis.AAC.3